MKEPPINPKLLVDQIRRYCRTVNCPHIPGLCDPTPVVRMKMCQEIVLSQRLLGIVESITDKISTSNLLVQGTLPICVVVDLFPLTTSRGRSIV